MILLDLGKADVVQIAPDQARHAAVEGRRVENAAPAELMALVFTRDRQSVEDGKLRQALGFSIDRESMNGVLLQGGGEPAGALLPGWMTTPSDAPFKMDSPESRRRPAICCCAPWHTWQRAAKIGCTSREKSILAGWL